MTRQQIDDARKLLAQAAGLLSYHTVSAAPAPVGDIVAATAHAERAAGILRNILLASAARPKPDAAVNQRHGKRIHPPKEARATAPKRDYKAADGPTS